MLSFILRQCAVSLLILGVWTIGGFSLAASLTWLNPRVSSQAPLGGTALALQVAHDTLGFITNLTQGRLSPLAAQQAGQGWLRSAVLLVAALGLTIGLGIGLGIASVSQTTRQTRLRVVLLSILGVSTPSFYWAMFLQFGLVQYAVATRTLPLPSYGFGYDGHMVLPTLALAAWPTAQVARLTAQLLSQELVQDYVRTARAKGLSRLRLALDHLWPNLSSGILTTVLAVLPIMLSSQMLVEWMYGWKGVAEYTLVQLLPSSASMAQLPLMRPVPEVLAVLGAALMLIYLPLRLVLVTLRHWLDPRLREETA